MPDWSHLAITSVSTPPQDLVGISVSLAPPCYSFGPAIMYALSSAGPLTSNLVHPHKSYKFENRSNRRVSTVHTTLNGKVIVFLPLLSTIDHKILALSGPQASFSATSIMPVHSYQAAPSQFSPACPENVRPTRGLGLSIGVVLDEGQQALGVRGRVHHRQTARVLSLSQRTTRTQKAIESVTSGGSETMHLKAKECYQTMLDHARRPCWRPCSPRRSRARSCRASPSSS